MIIQSDWDTISAISTPYGESGIGVVRLSGPAAKKIARKLFRPKHGRKSLVSHRVTYGEIVDPVDNTVIDEVLLLFMQKPKTYTREDVLEIQCHGGYLVLRKILECALREGARLAQPGEFTKRAFLNGRIDLAQAEAVIETIKAKTPAGLRVANEQLQGKLSGKVLEIKEILLSVLSEIEAQLDFPDEDLGELGSDGIYGDLEKCSELLQGLVSSFDDGRVLRNGLAVAIVGKTNVGKSSLLNRLLGDEKAIVTALPGTTRDVIEETMSLSGLTLRIVDTAGFQQWRNIVEREGIRRTKKMIREADLVLLVVDRSRPLSAEDQVIFKLIGKKKHLMVLNKIDLSPRVDKTKLDTLCPDASLAEVSARTGEGVEALREKIHAFVVQKGMEGTGDRIVVMAARHKSALEEARKAVERAKERAGRHDFLDIAALEIRGALDRLGEIVGEIYSEDLLDRIFSQFCIGK
ncbi:MAG: tRNA uridine-5-carboxymethylaminomethyl(34) synthesis GTPase MnmE [Proteobacteria bacterium]|nr:tRNA uridine-5-carboxymethylaminomethyl(34) synthesis GTPase MnmE [Pseudomonadota bacterium]